MLGLLGQFSKEGNFSQVAWPKKDYEVLPRTNRISQTCTYCQNTSISPGVWSFQVVLVNKFNLMEDKSLLFCWLVSEGLDLMPSIYMQDFIRSNSISCP